MCPIQLGDVIRKSGGSMPIESQDRKIVERIIKIILTIVVLAVEFVWIFPIFYNSKTNLWFVSVISVLVAFLIIYFIWRMINLEEDSSDSSGGASSTN